MCFHQADGGQTFSAIGIQSMKVSLKFILGGFVNVVSTQPDH